MLFLKARPASAILALALVSGLSALGCGDDAPATDKDLDSADGHSPEHDGHTAEHDAGDETGHDAHPDDTDLGEDDEPAPCTEAYPDFRPGLSAKGQSFTVRLLTIAPEPPRQKMDNDWTIELVDADGAALEGATIVAADSWMPVHQHGGRKRPTIMPLAQSGQFKLDNIDFRMLGPWQVRVDVKTTADATQERVALQLCVK
jgi:hypothetical protein